MNGPFFSRCAALKLDAEHLMPKTVHACLLLHAVNEKDRDHVATAVTDAMLKSLALGNLGAGMQVNQMLINAEKLCNDVELVGNFAVECMKFVFQIDEYDPKGTQSPKFKSLDEISQSFVDRISGAPTEPASSIVDDQQPANTIVPILQFSADGTDNNAGCIAVMEKGFKPGDVVETKEGSKGQQWQISVINDDGSVQLSKITDDAKVDATAVDVAAMKAFITGYRLTRRRQLLDGYPDNSGCCTNDSIEDFAESNAIGLALNFIINENANRTPFRIQTKPQQKLIALTDAPPGDIVLVPMTKYIVKANKDQVPSKVFNEMRSTVTLRNNVWILRKWVDAQCVPEYWLQRHSSNLAECNMHLKDFIIDLAISKSQTRKIVVTC